MNYRKRKRNRVPRFTYSKSNATHRTAIKDLPYVSRDTAQRDALNSWARKGFKGSIIAATGFGKSRVAVLAIGHSLDELEDDTARCLVLVPTQQLQDQFPKEFKKWGYEEYLDRIDFMCYASAHKMEGKHYHVVVCDEIHLGLSPVYGEFFNKNTYDRIMCLTATIPENPQYRMLLVNIAPICYKITLDEAVSAGYVAEYKLVCVPIEFTEEEREEYDAWQAEFVKHRAALGGEAANVWGRANAIITRRMKGNIGAAVAYMKAVRKRREVCIHAVNKLELTKRVVDYYDEDKVLTFSASNQATNDLAEHIGGESYHSDKTKKQQRELIEKFTGGELRILCSTKALNQGTDVPDVGVGVITGLDSKSLPLIQRMGRILRKDGDKIGKIFIFYVKDSQEEKWMKDATKSIKNVQTGEDLEYYLK